MIAQLTIHDRERYDRYAAGFMAVLRQFNGWLLAPWRERAAAAESISQPAHARSSA
ncbi:MAG TPA: DUF1330 domain-containing protein [Kofleriaceae bacterium]|nr:DUF1330 domain-containing protein [Kofleriaceae bacterium]